MSKQVSGSSAVSQYMCVPMCVCVGRGISSGIINKLHTCLATANLYISPHWQSYGHDVDPFPHKELAKTGAVHRNIFHRDSSERRRHSAGAVSARCQGAVLLFCPVLSCPPGAFDSGVRVKVLCRIMAGVKGEGLSCTEEKEVYLYLDNYLVYKPNEFVWA